MTPVSIISPERTIARAKFWLEDLSPSTRDAKALRSLGLLCCKRLQAGVGLHGRGGSAPLRLPTMRYFVTMDREKTLTLCRCISLASLCARRMEAKKQEAWSDIFGSVALSYARVGDVSTTAVLLRASAQLGLNHQWLVETARFLLDQQTPEGCFGLFARELKMVTNDGAPWMPHLNLTVEILWALAEVTGLHRGQDGGAGTRNGGIDSLNNSKRDRATIARITSLSRAPVLKSATLPTSAS